MASYTEIVDISSGEEEDDYKTKEPFRWISGMLCDGLDDLIVVEDLSTPAMKKYLDGKRDGFDDVTGRDDDGGDEDDDGGDEDDDCQVLDSDPDKPVAVIDGTKEVSNGSDEIEIVGETGQVACRDFPHPRHLCANFPFDTTCHDEHCKMCHCYVCDSPAPCAFWGNTTNSNNHCHATDKDPLWKKHRESKKNQSKIPSFFIPNFVNPPPSLTPWQPVTCNKSNMPILNPNPNLRGISQIQAQTTRIMRPCPTGNTGHRVGPYHPFGPRQLSRSSSIRAGIPPFNPVSNPSGPILNRSHSTSETLLRIQQNNVLRRSQSQLGVPSQPGQLTTQMATQVRAQTQSSKQENLDDVCSKSWQDIFASVASELGVPNYRANTPPVQQQQPIGTSNFVTHPNQIGDGMVNCTGFQNNLVGTHERESSQEGSSSGLVSSPDLFDFEQNW